MLKVKYNTSNIHQNNQSLGTEKKKIRGRGKMYVEEGIPHFRVNTEEIQSETIQNAPPRNFHHQQDKTC